MVKNPFSKATQFRAHEAWERSRAEAWRVPDWSNGWLYLWWGAESDPREASSFTVVTNDGGGSYTVERWDVNDLEEGDEVSWVGFRTWVDGSDLFGRPLGPRVAAAVGMEKISYSGGDSIWGEDEPSLPPEEWILERFGEGRPSEIIDPFSGKTIWLFRGGSFWRAQARQLGIRCLLRRTR